MRWRGSRSVTASFRWSECQGEKRISMADPLRKSRKVVADNLVSGMTSRRRRGPWIILAHPTLCSGWVRRSSLQKLQGLLCRKPEERLPWPIHLREECGGCEGLIRGRKGFRGAGNSGRSRGACFALRSMSADLDRVRRGYKGDHGQCERGRVRCNGRGAAPGSVYGEVYRC